VHGSQLASEIHGKYFEVAKRGQLFIGSTLIAGVALPVTPRPSSVSSHSGIPPAPVTMSSWSSSRSALPRRPRSSAASASVCRRRFPRRAATLAR
jgi:hypothetical protein